MVIGKIIAIVMIGIMGFFSLFNVFKFGDQGSNATVPSNQTELNETDEQEQTQPQFSLNPVDWVNSARDFFANILKTFSNIIMSYINKIFPSATPTFGYLLVILITLFFLWLLSTKFEAVFKAVILVLIIVVFCLLLMSIVGFV